MMCSTWKISVFGILALMLAFGIATTDALAVNGTRGNICRMFKIPPLCVRLTSETTITGLT